MTKTPIQKALKFAHKAHKGQHRSFTHVPYIGHPIAVAKTVAKYGGSDVEQIAALLHDVVEDTSVTIEDVDHKFGSDVSQLVAELTNDKDTEGYDTPEGKAEYLVRKMVVMSEPALFIKLADRLDNIRDMRYVPKDHPFYTRYLKETQYIIVQLGIHRDDLSSIHLDLIRELWNVIYELKTV